jgi:hypothetical protein
MDTSLLTDPESFFQQRSENPGLLRPLIIVFVAMIASAAGLLILFRTLLGEVPSVIAVGLAAPVIGAFIGPFLVWILLTIVFYLISIAVGGDGSLGDTFKLAGWGFVPQILSGIISAVATYIALQSVTIPQFPQSIDFQNTDQIQEVSNTLAEFMLALDNQTIVLIASVIGILLLIWQFVIWVFALKHARDLTTRGAIISVGIPVGLYILYSIYMLFG